MIEEPDEKALKASHNKVDDAIVGHLKTMGIDGLVTGWVLGVAVTHIEEDSEYDGLYSTTSENLSKWTNIGITSAMLDGAKELGSMEED